MRAIVIGPRVSDYDLGYNETVSRALQQSGFDTRVASFFVPSPPGLVNRVRIDAAALVGVRRYRERYVRAFNQSTLELYRAHRPHLVVVLRGSILAPETIDAMDGSVRVLWCFDSARRSDLRPEQLRCYDRRYVFEASDIPWLREAHGLDSTFLPLAFDPTVYHPIPDVQRDIDVFFVGAYYPSRRTILERLARDFPRRSLRFYGRHIRYREPDTWVKALYYSAAFGGTFVNRSLDPPAINGLYARSKICINIHHGQSLLGCNPRVFEIMGAGAPQIVDAVPFVLDHFSDAVITYNTYDQLRESVERLLADERARTTLAEEGLRVARERHTFAHRVRQLLMDSGF